MARGWTEAEQRSIDGALAQTRGALEGAARWKRVAELVGRPATECKARYKAIREKLQAESAAKQTTPEVKAPAPAPKAPAPVAPPPPAPVAPPPAPRVEAPREAPPLAKAAPGLSVIVPKKPIELPIPKPRPAPAPAPAAMAAPAAKAAPAPAAPAEVLAAAPAPAVKAPTPAAAPRSDATVGAPAPREEAKPKRRPDKKGAAPAAAVCAEPGAGESKAGEPKADGAAPRAARKPRPKKAPPAAAAVAVATEGGAAAAASTGAAATDNADRRPKKARPRKAKPPAAAASGGAASGAAEGDGAVRRPSAAGRQRKSLEARAAEWTPGAASEGAVAPAGGAAAPAKVAKWWKSLPVSEVDAITLEPLRRLAAPPFNLVEDGHSHLFDGRALAAYLISTDNFANPLTRTAMGADDCARLDAHLKLHGLTKGLSSALHAFSSKAGAADAAAETLRRRLRTEADAVMRSLFGAPRQRATLGDRYEEMGADITLGTERAAPPPPPAVRAVAPTQQAGAAFPGLPASVAPAAWAGAWAAERLTAIRSRAAEAPPPPVVRVVEAPRNTRLAAMASALGVEDRFDGDTRWPLTLLRWAVAPRATQEDLRLAPLVDAPLTGLGQAKLEVLERRFASACVGRADAFDLQPMAQRDTDYVAEWCGFYGLAATEYHSNGESGAKYLRVRRLNERVKDSNFKAPTPTLVAAAKRYSAYLAGEIAPPPRRQPAFPDYDPRDFGDAPEVQTRHFDPFEADDEPQPDAPEGLASARFENSRLRMQRPPAPEPAAPPVDEAVVVLPPTRTRWDALDSDEEDEAPVAVVRPRHDALADAHAECCCCLELLAGGGDVTQLACGHALHDDCLREWASVSRGTGLDVGDAPKITQTTTCPSCRAQETVFVAATRPHLMKTKC
ncbi:hypothetical protein M885DRAFT_587725 [Pelagophyceae sp. CCMP2097]|nr:hypothetical protein M885DRAFT_587725 [Pelagophyceae sp. CCMP2097]